MIPPGQVCTSYTVSEKYITTQQKILGFRKIAYMAGRMSGCKNNLQRMRTKVNILSFFQEGGGYGRCFISDPHLGGVVVYSHQDRYFIFMELRDQTPLLKNIVIAQHMVYM